MLRLRLKEGDKPQKMRLTEGIVSRILDYSLQFIVAWSH